MSRVSPARAAAYSILRRVESGRGYAVDLLQRSEVSALREEDRRLATELVMGVLRWRGELNFQIEKLSGRRLKSFDPEIATILRLGLYQIVFLAKIPKAAAVNQAVELTKQARKRSAAGLVNAVMRKCERATFAGEISADQTPSEAALKAAERTLPDWLGERWAHHFGAEAMRTLAWWSVRVPPVTLRVDAQRREAIAHELAGEGVITRRCRYAATGLRVISGNVHASRALAEGRVAIQDEASQIVALLVSAHPGGRLLDLCAAPGIKTSQLAGMLEEGTLVGCDLSGVRLRTMARLLRGRVPAGVRLHLVRSDASQPLPFRAKFDRVLLDVPCSGTGTLARNPEIKLRLQPADLARLAEIQKRMLRNARQVVAPGGRLVYATCSLEPEESERVVEDMRGDNEFRILSKAELAAEHPHLVNLFDEGGFFRTRPDMHDMDGFFAVVIVRGG